MSKTWKISQQVQNERDNFKAESEEEDKMDDAFVPYQEQRRPPLKGGEKRPGTLSKVFFALIVLSLLGLNAQLFLLAHKYVVKIDTIGTKIDDVQRSIALNKTEIDGVSNNVVTLKSRQEALESEFVDIKDQFIALSQQASKSKEVASLTSTVNDLSAKIAELIRSDTAKGAIIEDLEKKKDNLVRRFALYDAELQRLEGSPVQLPQDEGAEGK